MKPTLLPTLFTALALLGAATTSFGAEQSFDDPDPPTRPELQSPERLRMAIIKRLDVVDKKIDVMLEKRDVPPEMKREVKLQFKQAARLLRAGLATNVEPAAPKADKARKTNKPRPKVTPRRKVDPRPPSKSGRPSPVEAGRAPRPHRSGAQ